MIHRCNIDKYEHNDQVSSCSSRTLNQIIPLIVQESLCASWMKVRQLCAHRIKAMAMHLLKFSISQRINQFNLELDTKSDLWRPKHIEHVKQQIEYECWVEFKENENTEEWVTKLLNNTAFTT